MSIAPENQVPLIWTIHGNLPLSDVIHTTRRVDHVDQIELHEEWHHKHTGELVKNNMHALPLAPWQTGAGGRLERMTLAGAVASVG